METTVSAVPGLPFVDVTREFDAPRQLLFRAHTEPDLLVQWLGPEKYEMVIDRYEVRDGGRWRYVHRDADGNEYGFHGVFHGDPTPELMVQTFEYEGAAGHVQLDQVRMEEREGRTIAHVHTVFQTVEGRDASVNAGMVGGMTEGYRRLDALLARMAAPVA